MHAVIIGCGRLGSTLAKELSNEGHDVAIVDRDKERMNVLGSGFNGQKIRGIEFDDSILLEAGIDKADVFLAVTPDDNINITVSLIAKRIYSVQRIIARVCYPNRKYIYDRLGIETISPTQLGAQILKSRIVADNLDVITELEGDLQIVEIPAVKEKKYIVKDLEKNYSCIISGIISGGTARLPKKDDKVEHGDRIICTIDKNEKEELIYFLTGEMPI